MPRRALVMRALLMRALLITLPLFSGTSRPHGRRSHGVAAGRACPTCSVSLYQGTGFGTRTCGIGEFGCHPGTDTMWIRPPCGAFFKCAGAAGPAVQCGSRYFRPAPGQTMLNCSCASTLHRRQAVEESTPSSQQSSDRIAPSKRACGQHSGIDPSGGVSAAYRRLPQPVGADQSVKCCRNKPTSRGPINWTNTLELSKNGYAAWPGACKFMRTRICHRFLMSVSGRSGR